MCSGATEETESTERNASTEETEADADADAAATPTSRAGNALLDTGSSLTGLACIAVVAALAV